jgi:tetratricopeptide (TPR) repeat protein
MLYDRTSRKEKLFAQYFEVYPADIQLRSENDTLKLVKSAFDFYNGGEYGKANELFEKLAINHPQNDMIRFYFGITCLADGNYGKAFPIFSILAEKPTGSFYEQSRWYLALSTLRTGAERQVVIRLFSEIADANAFKSEEAKKILTSIQ